LRHLAHVHGEHVLTVGHLSGRSPRRAVPVKTIVQAALDAPEICREKLHDHIA
jgi:hypothetical protein